MHHCNQCNKYVIFISSSIEDKMNDLESDGSIISCSINSINKRKFKYDNNNIEICEPVKKKQKY